MNKLGFNSNNEDISKSNYHLNLPPPDRSIFLQSPPPNEVVFEEIIEDPPYKQSEALNENILTSGRNAPIILIESFD